ncbi:MAG: GIY-YIG nuclease family protein [Clostridia bacterium]|nr:GIY-YIG nuclease family protein [Clostridia bacterium]
MNYYIYFLTNKTNAVLYIGVTNDLRRRLLEHKNEVVEGFTKRYHVHKLIYYELYKHPQDAIVREKQLKKWTREKKNNLVASYNPQWEEITDIR